jgi:hypothetical protein
MSRFVTAHFDAQGGNSDRISVSIRVQTADDHFMFDL